MKRIRRSIGALLLALAITCSIPVSVWADAALDWYPQEEGVDYYVVVSAPDGGVNLRYGPGVEYDRLMENMIPNQVYLHVVEEAQASNGNYWGYTEYEGMYGWIALTQVSAIDGVPPTEATATPAPAQTTTETPVPTGTATPEATATQTPTATPTETVKPTSSPTETPAPTVTEEGKKGYTISYSLMAKLMAAACVILVFAILALVLLLRRKR